MTEIKGDIWKVGQGFWAICVTTNGIVKNNGCAVMGQGIALQAVQRYPGIDRRLGDLLRQKGNHVYLLNADLTKPFIISFPTKNDWRDDSSLALIQQSAHELCELMDHYRALTVIMTRPGCGNGHLYWPDVREVLLPIFADRPITIISPE